MKRKFKLTKMSLTSLKAKLSRTIEANGFLLAHGPRVSLLKVLSPYKEVAFLFDRKVHSSELLVDGKNIPLGKMNSQTELLDSISEALTFVLLDSASRIGGQGD